MRSKEDCYNEATLKSLGNNPNGTRMDVVYLAIDIYAEEYHKDKIAGQQQAKTEDGLQDRK